MKEIDNNQKADSSAHLERVIHVDIEGTLKEKLGADYDSFRKLTISGNINADDFSVVRGIQVLEDLNLENSVLKLEQKDLDETNTDKVELADYIFKGMDNLKSLVLPSNITHISVNAFLDCHSLLSIEIPKGVCSIGDEDSKYAFVNCMSIQEIKVSSDNLYFSDIDGILMNKDKTEIISYPRGREECNMVIPYGVKVIQDETFIYNETLTSIEIPESVEFIGEKVFCQCSNIKTIIVKPNNLFFADIDGILTNTDKTILKCYPPGRTQEYAVIPAGIKEIEESAFLNCYNLIQISIPNSVTTIGEGVFTYCSLDNIIISPNHPYFLYVDDILMNRQQTELIACINKHLKSDVVLPDGITSIPNSFFSYCKNIISIKSKPSVNSVYFH